MAIAQQIMEPLVESIAILESKFSPVSQDALRSGVRQAWTMMIDDVLAGESNLSSMYLAKLHRQLAGVAGMDTPGRFEDDGLPLSPQGEPNSWTHFLEEGSVDGVIEPAYVLAQLRWGEHVKSMAFSLGWLGMNIALIETEDAVIYPPLEWHEKLTRYLEYAGPDCYDAESLRAFIWECMKAQGLK